MHSLTKKEILRSFVNSSQSRIKTVAFPPSFDETDWEELDFYGWVDPRSPQRAYLVTTHASGVTGIELRRANSEGARPRSAMCNLCHAVHRHGGTALFTARKAGASGKAGNSIGTYLCTDFCCSLYARGLKLLPDNQPEHALPTQTRIAQLCHRLDGFVARVLTT
jgi:hypothetical protein